MSSQNQRNVINGAIAMTAATIIIKIIGVLYKVPLTYILGEEGMGYFNAAYTVYGFFYVISSAGIPKAITMLIARIDDGDSESCDAICRSLLKTFGICGAVLTVIFFTLARPISVLIGTERSAVTMLAIAPSIFFVTLTGVLRGYMNGRSKLTSIAISQLIEALCKLVFGLILALIGFKLLLPLPLISALAILGITLGSFFSLLYMYLSCFDKENQSKARQNSVHSKRKIFASVLIQAIPLTLSATISALSGLLDLGMVINGLRAAGYTENAASSVYGNYSTLAVPMIGLVSALLMPVSMAILPKLSKLSAESIEFSNALSYGWQIVLVSSAPISVMFFLYSFEILDILFPLAQSANGAASLTVLSVTAMLLPLLTLTNTALEASGKTGRALISLSLGILIKIIISALLIPNPSFGILGAALGSIGAYAASLILSIFFLGKSRRALKPWRSIAVPICAVIIYVPLYLSIYSINLIGNSTLSMIAAAIASTIIYSLLIIRPLLVKHFKSSTKHYAQKNGSLKVINS